MADDAAPGAGYEVAQLQTNHGNFKIIATTKELDDLEKGVNTPKWITFPIVPDDEGDPTLKLSVKPSEVCFFIRETRS